MDALDRCLSKLEAFDAERWAGQLATAQQEVAGKLAAWEREQAQFYTEEGRQQQRERIRGPELAARERAAQEAEAALAHVREARAHLDAFTGLSDAEMQTAEAQRWRYREDAELLDAETLARRIRGACELGDRVATWCYVRYGGRRLEALQAEAQGADDPVMRAKARAAAEALRPSLTQAAGLLDSEKVKRLRTVVAEQDRAAQRLRFRAGAPTREETIAAKRAALSGML